MSDTPAAPGRARHPTTRGRMAKRKAGGDHVPAGLIERAGARIMSEPELAARLAGTAITDGDGNGFRVDAKGKVSRVRGRQQAKRA
jgi:hypothetical protein